MSAPSAENIRPPSLLLFLLEYSRAAIELGAFYASGPLLNRFPEGDGHPVLVLPGFGAGDFSTIPLRKLLKHLGYAPYGWGQGLNWGMTPQIKQKLAEKVKHLRQKHGKKVSLIGWSLGGVFAREMAKHQTEDIRFLITMGTPFTGSPRANNFWRLFNLANPQSQGVQDLGGFNRRSVPPPVPTTSILSRTDGIVAWRCSVEQNTPLTETVEVPSSHLGMGHNPITLYLIADRLAQPEKNWTSFVPSGFLAYLYKDPRRSSH